MSIFTHILSSRRRLEKSLNKVETIRAHAQQHLDTSAYKEYQNQVDKNFVHFFAVLSLTMADDYRWKEDETHDQISSLLERVGKNIDKYANQGLETEDLIKKVEGQLGIVLIPAIH